MNKKTFVWLVLLFVIGLGILGITRSFDGSGSAADSRKKCWPNPDYRPTDLWWKPSEICEE